LWFILQLPSISAVWHILPVYQLLSRHYVASPGSFPADCGFVASSRLLEREVGESRLIGGVCQCGCDWRRQEKGVSTSWRMADTKFEKTGGRREECMDVRTTTVITHTGPASVSQGPCDMLYSVHWSIGPGITHPAPGCRTWYLADASGWTGNVVPGKLCRC